MNVLTAQLELMRDGPTFPWPEFHPTQAVPCSVFICIEKRRVSIAASRTARPFVLLLNLIIVY